jgi:hypothetical protein
MVMTTPAKLYGPEWVSDDPKPVAPMTGVTHTNRERGGAVYERLRAVNPHLPPADKILVDPGFSLNVSEVSTLTITVLVDLPPGGEG